MFLFMASLTMRTESAARSDRQHSREADGAECPVDCTAKKESEH